MANSQRVLIAPSLSAERAEVSPTSARSPSRSHSTSVQTPSATRPPGGAIRRLAPPMSLRAMWSSALRDTGIGQVKPQGNRAGDEAVWPGRPGTRQRGERPTKPKQRGGLGLAADASQVEANRAPVSNIVSAPGVMGTLVSIAFRRSGAWLIETKNGDHGVNPL